MQTKSMGNISVKKSQQQLLKEFRENPQRNPSHLFQGILEIPRVIPIDIQLGAFSENLRRKSELWEELR